MNFLPNDLHFSHCYAIKYVPEYKHYLDGPALRYDCVFVGQI